MFLNFNRGKTRYEDTTRACLEPLDKYPGICNVIVTLTNLYETDSKNCNIQLIEVF